MSERPPPLIPPHKGEGNGIINFHGTWKLRCAARSIEVDYAVPGDVHSALIKSGHIPDPYVGTNELACLWVTDEEWVASRTFQLENEPDGEWELDIDYLDTVADVSVNGEKVLSAENCFRRYQPDVTKVLRKGENRIEVVLHSNTKAANEKQAAQPFYMPYSTNNCPIPNGNMLRKPQCHFGWDWNLAIVPFGMCGSFSLNRNANVRIEDILVTQDFEDEVGAVVVKIDVKLSANADGKLVEYEYWLDGQHQKFVEENETEWQSDHARFVVRSPKLWWPTGQGEQHLYDLKIRCGDQVVHRKIGLRQIEVLSDKDAVGSRFAVRVNNREIFCRGANWIPVDALPSKCTAEQGRKLLQAAVDANMNMIRVWGGGYYEPDWFYDACDELGILIWQDFQFSCNLYPSTDAFIDEVKEEVRQQVSRLQHHACIALWCGDNELIGALTWYEAPKKNRDRYLVNYDRLNRAIESAAKSADPNINWWPSSPSPGVLDFGDAWHDDSKGDMHFWSVWHEGKDFEHYRDVKPRFCSEFGFQSFPSMRICKQFVESDDDLNISSEVMQHHQRNAGGNARIAETMFRYFRFPVGFANFVYVSQIQHGLAMQTAVDYWRSLKPHCMGTLMWQLNDTWPVASWSGLDHDGGWKAMHHMARDFYAPVAVVAIPNKENTSLRFMAINDTPEETEVVVQLKIVMMDGTTHNLPDLAADVLTDKSVEIGGLMREDIPEGAMLFWSWNGIRRHFAFKPYKYLKLPAPCVTTKVKDNKVALEIAITAKALALHVMLECDVAGHFSKNVFDLLAGETQKLIFTPNNPADLKRAKDSLHVRDLYSSSH
jgi:beta-mannosidase